MCLPSGKQPDAFGHQDQPEGDDEDRAALEQIFVVPLREKRPEQAEQKHKDARARAEGEHAHRAACPRPGRGGEDPHRRQRAARHQAGQQPDGERLAPEAAGPGQFGTDPAQKRHAPHPEPDEHHEQPADGQEHKGKLPPILSGSLLFIESTIPDTLFFQPAFPFSDYCLKRGKAQFVEYQPEES